MCCPTIHNVVHLVGKEGVRMIQIEDYDLPIMVAHKIINGTKIFEANKAMKTLRKAVTGIDEDVCTCDMFELEEIKEIADYLMVYYNAHKDGD